MMDYKKRWNFASSAYDGFDSSMLVQFNREHDDKFSSRQELSYYVNYIKPKAKQFVSYLTQKNITRKLNNNLLDLMLTDVDKKGNAIDVFMQNFSVNAKVRGVNLCLIDMPEINSSTLQEQTQSREVPYFVELHPESIYQYKIDEFGKFDWVILEASIDTTEPFGNSETETIYRYYDKTSWKVYDDKMENILKSGEHNIGECPVVVFSESGMFPSAGDYVQIADISKRIMNLRSELDEILRSQTFSLLTYQIDNIDELKSLEVGTNNLLLYKNERPDFISAPDAPARVYQEEIDRLEGLIEEIASTNINIDGTTESGISKKYRFQALNASLINFAQKLEDFERNCFNIASKWLEIENKTEVSYPKDYNMKDVKGEIEVASALFDIDLGDTFKTLKKEQLAFLDLNGLEESQKEIISSEIEANTTEVQNVNNNQ